MILLTGLIHGAQAERPKPVVIITPGKHVFSGEKVSFKCELQGEGDTEWTYSWYKNNNRNPPFSTTQEFSRDSVTDSDSGEYTCSGTRHSDSQSSEISDPVTLTVLKRPKPVVITTPGKQVFSGEKVNFKCELQGGGDTKWTYSWYKKDSREQPYRTTQEFSRDPSKDSDSGEYTCSGRRHSDSQSSEISDPFTLTVSTKKPEPELTSDLKGAALTGNSVTLYCTLKLQSAGWNFYWITPTQSRETETETHSYTIRSVRVSDEGRYWCRAARGNPVYYTHYSDALWVNVIESPKPVVIIKPDTQVFRGEIVTFRCEIKTGRDTEWNYDWYKDDNTLNPNHATQEFTISPVTDSSRGKYTCRGRRHSDNQISETSDSVTLTVSENPKPVVIIKPDTQVFRGETVTFRCEIQTGRDTEWNYDWYKDDNTLDPNHTTQEFTISPVTDSSRGKYTCRGGDTVTIRSQ
ncbi:carcinoembryonic antigen-related cell adhesion molecule 5-like isoform X2 [Silurus meridionalis]|uniref:carcinoembryonic antigen-related cell adhesion molecule 5-like isoform X2 n=1 Tax=Silurus meridionalis TaxID=175797 RepID=UPI001EEB568D|nr:carcinoembryonic antigen-related cell adhesion molecule 5-like isoform X2 [Silurus meridionalis]